VSLATPHLCTALGFWVAVVRIRDKQAWLLLAVLWPTTMMLFGIYFPERLGLDRRFPWAKWMVIAPILFQVLGTNVAFDLLVLKKTAAAVEIDRLFSIHSSLGSTTRAPAVRR